METDADIARSIMRMLKLIRFDKENAPAMALIPAKD